MNNVAYFFLLSTWHIPLLSAYTKLSWGEYIYWVIGVVLLLITYSLKGTANQRREDFIYPQNLSIAFLSLSTATFLPHLSTLLTRVFIVTFLLFTFVIFLQRSGNNPFTIKIDRSKSILIIIFLLNIGIVRQINEPIFIAKIFLYIGFIAFSLFFVSEKDNKASFRIRTLMVMPCFVILIGISDIVGLYLKEQRILSEYDMGNFGSAAESLIRYEDQNWPSFNIGEASFYDTLATSLIFRPELSERIVRIKKKHGLGVSSSIQLSIADKFSKMGNTGDAQRLFNEVSTDTKDPVMVLEYMALKSTKGVNKVSLLNCELDHCGFSRWATNGQNRSEKRIEKLSKGFRITINYSGSGQVQSVYDYWAIDTSIKKSSIDYGIKLKVWPYSDCIIRLVGNVQGMNNTGTFASPQEQLKKHVPHEISIFPMRKAHILMRESASQITLLGVDTYGKDLDLWIQEIELFTINN